MGTSETRADADDAEKPRKENGLAPIQTPRRPTFAEPEQKTYGFDEGADVRAVNWSADGGGSRFTVQTQDGWQRELHLNLPGRHNTLNALAAIAIGRELGVNDDAIASALQEFQGIGRRCESHGELRIGDKTALLIDDYGHHPVSYTHLTLPTKRIV